MFLDVFFHHANGLRGGPGGHVELFRKYAGPGGIRVVGHTRVEQAEISPALFRKPVQVVIPVSRRQESPLLVRDDLVESIRCVLWVNMTLSHAVGLVTVTLEHPAERVRFVPGRHVVKPDHAVGDRTTAR